MKKVKIFSSSYDSLSVVNANEERINNWILEMGESINISFIKFIANQYRFVSKSI